MSLRWKHDLGRFRKHNVSFFNLNSRSYIQVHLKATNIAFVKLFLDEIMSRFALNFIKRKCHTCFNLNNFILPSDLNLID